MAELSLADARLREILGDRYRLERELGRGGMATVYLASDLKHDRLVALKVLHPEVTTPQARLGKPEPARQSYAWVAGMWRTSDPSLQPYVAEARAGLVRLAGE